MTERPASGGWPLLLVLLALFAVGGGWLLSNTVVRDVQHPAYSTLNDTPKGTRLLFEALDGTGHEPVRLFGEGELPAGATLFRIGQDLSLLSLERLLQRPEEAAFVAGGGRLVCAFSGWQPGRRTSSFFSPCGSCSTGRCAVASTNAPASAPLLAKGLGLTALTNLTETARAAASDGGVPWHSVAVFDIAPAAAGRWQTRYTLEGRPVMIETRFGKGSVVLATDCFFLSNEALAATRDRPSALLAALIGPARTVLFDETVHGLRDRHNTTWLLLRYRLHVLLAVLALLFLLTLWQHACPLLPPQEVEADAPQRGLRMEDGLVSLLRRHLAAARLPRQLFDLWRQSEPHAPQALCEEMSRLIDHAEASHAPPEETCRALHRLAQRHRPAHRPQHARMEACAAQGDTP